MPSKRILKKAAEFLDQPMFHGGTYARGDEVSKPLYMTPNKEMAQSYVDFATNPGSRLLEMKPQVKNPAPERLVRAAIKRHVPENEYMGYTPATAFDPNLHEYKSIQALIDELTKRGYDSAIATDIGMGHDPKRGTPHGDALVLFPGAKAYKDGGKVDAKDEKAAFGVFPQMKPRRRGKSDIGDKIIDTLFIPHDPLDLALMAVPYGKAGRTAAAGIMALSPMDAEAGKVGKTLQAMKDELLLKGAFDPSRRSLFGLRPTQDMAGRELTKVEKQFAKEGQAPTVTKSTTSVSPDAGKTSSTIEKLVQTPVSRRQVLQTGASQLMQGALPKGALPTTLGGVEEIVQQAAPPVQYGLSAIPGLMAKLMRQGMSPEEAGRVVESMVPGTLNKWPEIVGERIQAPAERLPYMSEQPPLMSIFGEMVKPAFQRGPFSLRPEMRGLRDLSPEDYEILKQTARDIKDYGFEP